jgi:hypothetical protein
MAQQTSEVVVPQVVQDAFVAKFPAATAVSWEMEADALYEVEYKIKATAMSAVFAADGSWQASERRLKVRGLPQAVRDAIASQFAAFEIEEAEQVERLGEAMVYEVALEHEATGAVVEATFDVAGSLLQQETEAEEANDDDGE